MGEARQAARPAQVEDVVCWVLCFELGFEPEDLTAEAQVWDIGVDALDLASLRIALEDELDTSFPAAGWRAQTGRPGLTFAELVRWCEKMAPHFQGGPRT